LTSDGVERWFAGNPDPLPFDILAYKNGPAVYEGDKGGVELGLQVILKAKPLKVSLTFSPIHALKIFSLSLYILQIPELKLLLSSVIHIIEAEALTTHWIAFHVPDTNIFGVFGFFANEQGKNEHLQGKMGEALYKKAEELLEAEPEVKAFEVVAGNIN
jgi:hypothetical protein